MLKLALRLCAVTLMCALLIAAGRVFGRGLPGGAQLTFSTLSGARMVTQIVDTRQNAQFLLPTRFGSSTPLAWLDRDRLLLTINRVEFGALPGAGVFVIGQGLQPIAVPPNCFPDTLSGAGGHLACVERDGAGVLMFDLDCALRACDEAPRQIWNASGVFTLMWSPDGARVALVSVNEGGNAVVVIDTNGAVILRANAGTINPQPAWSHDGSQLAFFRRDGRDLMLEIVDVTSAAQREVELGRGAQTQPFVWSPDGETAALVENYVYNPPATQLIAVDLRTGNAESISSRVRFNIVQFPQWSPDGGLIAFYGSGIHYGGGLLVTQPKDGTVRMLARTPLLSNHFIWRPCAAAGC